ncbi:hypothetical protein ACWERY_01805 [Streptomyces sp. NPDC004082]
MPHRPYPNRDRALRQVDRHDDETPPIGTRPAVTLSRLTWNLAEVAQGSAAEAGAALSRAFANLRVQPPVDEYRLSTR